MSQWSVGLEVRWRGERWDTEREGERGKWSSPIFLSSLKPSRRKPREVMQACVKRARASYELLRSDVVSSFGCVGSASAMAWRMASGRRGLVMMMEMVGLFLLRLGGGLGYSG